MKDSSAAGVRRVPPYSVLASGYDEVMAHVDYDAWASYMRRLLRRHCSGEVQSVLELGCGTGAFAVRLQPAGQYRYVGTDASAEMIRVARAKAEEQDIEVTFEVADGTSFSSEERFDVVLFLYDSINYLLEEEHVEALLQRAYEALRPGGLFLFDQSTPSNSADNAEYFHDEGETAAFAYRRLSRYDADRRLHTTTFEMEKEGKQYVEVHVQRAYSLGELQALIEASPLEVVATYHQQTLQPARASSHRVHWVLRRPVFSSS